MLLTHLQIWFPLTNPLAWFCGLKIRLPIMILNWKKKKSQDGISQRWTLTVVLFFLILNRNICCCYLLELSQCELRQLLCFMCCCLSMYMYNPHVGINFQITCDKESCSKGFNTTQGTWFTIVHWVCSNKVGQQSKVVPLHTTEWCVF